MSIKLDLNLVNNSPNNSLSQLTSHKKQKSKIQILEENDSDEEELQDELHDLENNTINNNSTGIQNKNSLNSNAFQKNQKQSNRIPSLVLSKDNMESSDSDEEKTQKQIEIEQEEQDFMDQQREFQKQSSQKNIKGSQNGKLNNFLQKRKTNQIQLNPYDMRLLLENLNNNQKLNKLYVNLKEEEDQDIVIMILKKTIKTKEQMRFLAKAIEGLSLFKAKKEETIGSDNVLFRLCKHLSLKTFKKYDVIFNQGEFGKEYFIVIKGSVLTLIKNRVVDEEQQQQQKLKKQVSTEEQNPLQKFLKKKYKDFSHVFTFLPGTAFGEIALMTNEKRTATMVCEEDTHCMVLSREGFNTIMKAALDKVTDDKYNFISSFSFFKSVNRSNMDSFMHQYNPQPYRKNYNIYNDNEPLEGKIYFVKSGEVELSSLIKIEEQDKDKDKFKTSSELGLQKLNLTKAIKKNNSSIKRQTVVVKGPNSFFGEYEYLNNQKVRKHRATILTQAQLFCFDSKGFIQFLKEQNIFNSSLDQFIKESLISHNWEKQHMKELSQQKIIYEKIQKKQNIQNDMPEILARNVERQGYEGSITSSQIQSNQTNLMLEKAPMCNNWKKSTEEELQQAFTRGTVPLNSLIKQNYKNEDEFNTHGLLQKKLQLIESQEIKFRKKAQNDNYQYISHTIHKIQCKLGTEFDQENIIGKIPISYFQENKFGQNNNRKSTVTKKLVEKKSYSKSPTLKNRSDYIIKNMYKTSQNQFRSQSQDPKLFSTENNTSQNFNDQTSVQNQSINLPQYPNDDEFVDINQQKQPQFIINSPKTCKSSDNNTQNINIYDQNQLSSPLNYRKKQLQMIKQNLANQELITPKNYISDNSPSPQKQLNKNASMFSFSTATQNQNQDQNQDQDQELNSQQNDKNLQKIEEDQDNQQNSQQQQLQVSIKNSIKSQIQSLSLRKKESISTSPLSSQQRYQSQIQFENQDYIENELLNNSKNQFYNNKSFNSSFNNQVQSSDQKMFPIISQQYYNEYVKIGSSKNQNSGFGNSNSNNSSINNNISQQIKYLNPQQKSLLQQRYERNQQFSIKNMQKQKLLEISKDSIQKNRINMLNSQQQQQKKSINQGNSPQNIQIQQSQFNTSINFNKNNKNNRKNIIKNEAPKYTKQQVNYQQQYFSINPLKY